ncbi:hypothetical protein DFJ43DRAFT_1085353 [Lentinula guzmanii]|uniref:DUF6532 domain-containing protein n=1 Tax=Lentinula guzmanii TaxID=2804957 RepID=A0AA38J896_9AGAR|nr:hypothetical protein DFJ43DRAFT_1085353 [Lentinula guzmanii]
MNEGYKSDVSSTIDASMLFESEDEGHTSAMAPPKIVSRGQSTKRQKVAQDIKYNAERPSMVNLSEAGVEVSSLSRSDLEESSNAGWPVVTHLVYPIHSRCISVNSQSQTIKDLLKEAILLAVGLAIFQDGFATSDVQVTHSRTSITSAATKQELPEILHRFEQDRCYAKYLTDYVTGRVGTMRKKLKEMAADLVPSLYGIHEASFEDGSRRQLVETLLSQLNYIFPRTKITDASTARYNEPYRHPALVAVIHRYFFAGKKPLGHRFRATFTSSIKTDDAKEIPKAMLGLAAVAIYDSLKEWVKGEGNRVKKDFDSESISGEYDRHMKLINEKIIKADGSGQRKYHTLMSRLYQDALSY